LIKLLLNLKFLKAGEKLKNKKKHFHLKKEFTESPRKSNFKNILSKSLCLVETAETKHL